MNRLSAHWFSWGVMFLWAVIWLLDASLGLSNTFANKGISHLNGQYYRYFTSLLLHSGFLHMVFNGAAMYFVGSYLEPQISPWKLMLFSVSIAVITEAVFSCIYQGSESVGGSPVVFALIGLIVAMQVAKNAQVPFRLGTWYGNWVLGYAVLANIPIFSSGTLAALLIHGCPLVLGFCIGCLGIKIF